jgi:hypothetical protein
MSNKYTARWTISVPLRLAKDIDRLLPPRWRSRAFVAAIVHMINEHAAELPFPLSEEFDGVPASRLPKLNAPHRDMKVRRACNDRCPCDVLVDDCPCDTPQVTHLHEGDHHPTCYECPGCGFLKLKQEGA